MLRQEFLIRYFRALLEDHLNNVGNRQDYSQAELLLEKYDTFSPEGRIVMTWYIAALIYYRGDYQGALDRFDYFMGFVDAHEDIRLDDDAIKRRGTYFYALIDTLNQSLELLKRGNTFTGEDMERLGAVAGRLREELKDPVYNRQRAYAELTSMEAAYFLGAMPLHRLLTKMNHTAKQGTVQFYADRDTYHFLYAADYIRFLFRYAEMPAQRKLRQCEIVMNHVLEVYRNRSKTMDTFYTTHYCAEFIQVVSECLGFDRLREFVLNITVYADKALFLHTIMVKKIGRVLLTEILNTNPHFLDGVCQMDEDYIASHPLELMEIWQQCAMFHDIGKHLCIDYVSNSSRNLTEEEFQVIQGHPTNFDHFFARSTGPLFDRIRACARNHHVWYNGQGGYPAPEPTADKPMVDILSIADSIDAATDIIGRPYTAGKTLDMLIEEFDTFRDTRYSAYVIDVLKRPHVKDQIEHLIHVERKHLNYLVYTSRIAELI